jgi:hypothetical protein
MSKLKVKVLSKRKNHTTFGFSFHHGTNVGAGSPNLLPGKVYHGKTPKDKSRIMETQIFHHEKIQSSKNPLKETKIIQDIRTL